MRRPRPKLGCSATEKDRGGSMNIIFVFIFTFGLNRPSALIFRKISVEMIRVRMTSQAEAICFLMILRMTEIS